MRTELRFAALAILIAVAACSQKTEEPAEANVQTGSDAPGDGASTTEDSNLAFRPAQPDGDTLQNEAASVQVVKEAAENAREQWRGKSFEEFKASVYREPFEGGKYIVSGDTAIADDKRLLEFFENNIQGSGDSPGDGRLAVMAGADGVWSNARKKQLAYCVSDAFGPRKPKVVADMTSAAQAWEAVADVKYVYSSNEDGACTAGNDSVVFDVRPVNVNGRYLARAFFPNESRTGRNVLIDESSFHVAPTGNLQLAGILRHELGHTLGFRHEHTRPESGTCFEDGNWVPRTDYDQFSVMHYPHCNGAGDWTLSLTARDKHGAACTYGSASGFQIDETLVQGCATPVAPPASPGDAQVRTFAAQTLAKGAMNRHGPFAAKPGTTIVVTMTPSGSAGGDADLYVRLASAPAREAGKYNCRPYTSGTNETCEISARESPRNNAHVMVHGYTAATYDLKVSYVPQ